MATWDNIIKAGQAGRMIGDSIGSFASLIGESPEERRQKEYQMQLLELRRKQQLEDLANENRMQAYKNPEMGLIPLQPGQQAQGPVMQESGIPGLAYSQAQRELENKRLLEFLRQKSAANNSADPSYQFIPDPVTGRWYSGNRRTGTAEATKLLSDLAKEPSTFETQVKPSEVELSDPSGVKTKYLRYPDGTLKAVGVTDIPKGHVLKDETTGSVSLINPTLPKNVGAGQVGAATQSGTTAQPFATTPKPKDDLIASRSDQFRKDESVQRYREGVASARSLMELAKDPNATAADDIAMIFTFMKALDPRSTVRESEQATAQNAAGIPERVRNLWNQAIAGNRLTPNQRNEFVQASKKSLEGLRSNYQSIRRDFQNQEKSFKVQEGSFVGEEVDDSFLFPRSATPSAGSKQTRSGIKYSVE